MGEGEEIHDRLPELVQPLAQRGNWVIRSISWVADSGDWKEHGGTTLITWLALKTSDALGQQKCRVEIIVSFTQSFSYSFLVHVWTAFLYLCSLYFHICVGCIFLTMYHGSWFMINVTHAEEKVYHGNKKLDKNQEIKISRINQYYFKKARVSPWSCRAGQSASRHCRFAYAGLAAGGAYSWLQGARSSPESVLGFETVTQSFCKRVNNYW